MSMQWLEQNYFTTISKHINLLTKIKKNKITDYLVYSIIYCL